MKILIIMDPLDRLKIEIDTSIHILREFVRRGHQTWICDVPDIVDTHQGAKARCQQTIPLPLPARLEDRILLSKNKKKYRPFSLKKSQLQALSHFDLILIRKEPPFDENYYYLTLILERTARHTPVLNSPAAIRAHNEKLSILHFFDWIPPTLVTTSLQSVVDFKRRLKSPIVIKPLNNRGGRDVTLVRKNSEIKKTVMRLTQNETRFIMTQKYIPARGDKRIMIVNGDFLTAYRKKFAQKDFRGNFSQGASYEKTQLTEKEKRLLRTLRPYLRKTGLSFVGIDVLEGKLIDFNVTCPGGLVEASVLHPEAHLVQKLVSQMIQLAR